MGNTKPVFDRAALSVCVCVGKRRRREGGLGAFHSRNPHMGYIFF